MLSRHAVWLAITVFAMLLLLVGTGCRHSSPNAVIPPAANTHAVESAKGYTVNIPNGWEENRLLASGLIDKLFIRPRQATQSFAENVNIIVEPLRRAMPLDVYCNGNLNVMQRSMTSYRLVSKTDFVGNTTGKKVVYTWGNASVSLKVSDYIFVEGNNGYIITCTATATATSYAQCAQDFDDIGRSFRLKSSH